MPFLHWVATAVDTQAIDLVITAIETLDKAVTFTWGFAEISPRVEQLPPLLQQQAAWVIGYFEGQYSLNQLKKGLYNDC